MNLVKCDSISSTTQYYNITWTPSSNIHSFILSYYELYLEVENFNRTEHIGRAETFKILSIPNEYAIMNKNLTVKLSVVDTCGRSAYTVYSTSLSTTTASLVFNDDQSRRFHLNPDESIVILVLFPMIIITSIIAIILVIFHQKTCSTIHNTTNHNNILEASQTENSPS